MRDQPRLAYAQARIQARHGRRPDPGFWRAVDATRDFEHVVELIRSSVFSHVALGLSPQTGVHELERRLREEWRAASAEAAAWYPRAWRPAFLWMGWLPWLPALTWLAAGKAPPPWMREDPVLVPLLDEAGPAAALPRTALAPLAGGFAAGGSVRAEWRRQWRRRWRPLAPAHARGLERLDAALVLPLMPANDAPADFEAVLDEAGGRILRLFRRHAGTPVAGLAWLALGALDRLHLRAALSASRLFGSRAVA